MLLLQTPLIQETLEHLYITFLDIFECTSAIDLIVEFKRIKTVEIHWEYSEYEDKLQELKLEIKQFEEKLRKKHSQIKIKVDYQERIRFFT